VSPRPLCFFLVAFGTVFLLCGLAIDSGLLYLAKARMSRACDAAVISGVANFGQTPAAVAQAMYAVAQANYTDLSVLGSSPTITNSGFIASNGQWNTNFVYTFNSSTGNGAQFQAVLQLGPTGYITVATANGTSPVQTHFMGYTGIAALKSYTIANSATAQRLPRMVVLVLDRSGSMQSNSGWTSMPPAVTNFLSRFDTNGDKIGIYSFASAARREVPITNNFWVLGTNSMYNPTATTTANQNGAGIRFGSSTAPDTALRLGLEDMIQEDGFNSPTVLKYIVFFTDGVFNTFWSLGYHPGYTNIAYGPTNMATGLPTASTNHVSGVALTLPGQLPTMGSSSGNAEFTGGINYGTNYYFPSTVSPTPGTGGTWTNYPQLTHSYPVLGNTFQTNLVVNLLPGMVGYKYKSNVIQWTNYGNISRNVANGQITAANVTATNIHLNLFESYVLINPGYTNLPIEMGFSGGNIYCPYDVDDNRDMVPDFPPSGNGYYPEPIQWSYTNIFTSGGTYPLWTNLNQVYYPLPFEIVTSSIGKSLTNGWLYFNANGPMYYPNYAATTPTQNYTNMVALPLNGMRWDTTTNNPWGPSGGSGPYTNRSGMNLGQVIVNNSDGTKWTNIGVENFCDTPLYIYLNSSNAYYSYDYNYFQNGGSIVPATDQANYSASLICYHARAMGITIYALGFGACDKTIVGPLANDPSQTPFYASQPIGAFYFATNSSQINTLLQTIAGKISAALTQ